MTLQRPFLSLLPAFAVLLAFAGAPAAADGPRPPGAATEVAGLITKPVVLDDRAQDQRPDPTVAAAHLDVDDEKGAQSAPKPQLAPVLVGFACRISARTDRRAPAPTHRSCAAPPTGPPHA